MAASYQLVLNLRNNAQVGFVFFSSTLSSAEESAFKTLSPSPGVIASDVESEAGR
jgi:hypothetical protein